MLTCPDLFCLETYELSLLVSGLFVLISWMSKLSDSRHEVHVADRDDPVLLTALVPSCVSSSHESDSVAEQL